MTYAHFNRLLMTVGWAIALLALATVWSAPAKACFVFVRYSVAVSAIITECIVGPDSVLDHDQMIPVDDDLASSSPADFVLRMLSGYRSNLSAVNNVVDKNTAPIVFNVGADVLDTAVSDLVDDPGPGAAPPQHADLRVALAGVNPNQPADRRASAEDVLYEAAKSYAAAYRGAISFDGEVGALLRLGAEAIHSTLDGDAAASGASSQYQSISLDGAAADTGLPTPVIRQAGVVAPPHEPGAVAYYLAAAQHFLFSRDGMIGILIVLVAYITIAGLLSLVQGSRKAATRRFLMETAPKASLYLSEPDQAESKRSPSPPRKRGSRVRRRVRRSGPPLARN